MKKTLLIKVIILLFISKLSFSQAFFEKLPKDKPIDSLSLYDYRKAFDDYWQPYNVVNGYYTDDSGVEQKAANWKLFNRWFYYMEPRVDAKTGAFPTTTSQEQYSNWLSNNPSQQGFGAFSTGSWSSVGPSSSSGGYAGTGRLNCVAFHPSDNNTFWVGSPAGGLWKTSNGGNNWTVLTDNNAVLGVSDIGIPSDYATSSTIYIATGDRDGGSMWSLGGGQSNDNNSVGVLKSTDGGATWNATGLVYTTSQRKILSKILVHPSTTSTLYVAGTDGILKSTNGGSTWSSIYNSEVVMDIEFKPGDPTTLYASTMDYWGDIYILVSTNSGTTWTTVATFASTNKRIELAVSSANSSYVYAIVTTRSGTLEGIYRSNNSGASFTKTYDGTVANHNLLSGYTDGSGTTGQGNYDLSLAVSSTNINEVYLAGVITHKSTDGGATWNAVNCWTSYNVYNKNNAPVVHADHHMLKFRDADNKLFEVNDGGIYTTTNGGSSWSHITGDLTISQLYRLSVGQTVANEVLAGLQDNGTKLLSGGNWSDVKGGDGMDCHIDPTDANTQYGAYVYGQISRTTNHWGSATDIEPSAAGNGWWFTPYTIDPNNSNILYACYADVWKTVDQGNNWTKISTMNTTNSYGTGDLRAIAVAPSNSNYIYVSDPNQVWLTSNGGSSWSDITGSLPVASNAITYLAVKDNDPNTVWVTFGNYNAQRIYESTNAGGTWTDISNGLPNIPIMCVVQNKLSTGQDELYVGTDVGVYLKSGTSAWTAYNSSLPNVLVTDLSIYYDNANTSNSRLYAGTSGRGVWKSPLNSTGCTPPTTQASNFTASNLAASSMTVSWTRGSGNKVLVLAHEAAPVDSDPASGNTYTANASFGSGDQIGTGNYVVYDGTGTSVNVSALTSGTTMYYALYEYNTVDNCYFIPALTGQATTLGAPTVSTNAISAIFSSTATGGGNVTSLNGSNLIHKGVCWSTTNNPTTTNSHTDDIASGTGVGSYSSSLTGLSASTTYYVRAYATNTSGTSYGNEVTFVTSCGVITSFPWNEDFENGGAIPGCWSQDYVTGTTDYTYEYGGHSSNPAAAHGGSYNALLYMASSSSDHKTKLISPQLDFSSVSNPTLSFWHAQALWSPDQDELRVYYRTTSTSAWVLIPGQEYTSDISNWTHEVNIALPNPTATYYISFEGNAKYGYGVALDDVKIEASIPIVTKTTYGKTTKCSPGYYREVPGGSNTKWCFYDKYSFTVANSGSFDITANWTQGTGTTGDGFLYLYENSFDPDNPATNLIAYNDDNNGIAQSKIAGQSLTSGITYIIVGSEYNDNKYIETMEFIIEGQGSITANAITDYNGVPDNATHDVPPTNGIKTSTYGCDDQNGWTHYYSDNGSSAAYSDDLLLLSIKKNSQNIGTDGDGTFSVQLKGNAGASYIAPSSSFSKYVNSFNGWYVYNRYWEVTPNPQPVSDVEVRFYYQDADFNDLNSALSAAGRDTKTSRNDLSVYKINDLTSAGYDPNPANGHNNIPKASAYNADGAWIYNAASSSSSNKWIAGDYRSDHYFQYTVAHFSGGGGGASGNSNDGTLPIELLSFNAFANGDINQVVWKTATEFNVERFIIERMNPVTQKIEEIGSVKAVGNSNVIQSYSFDDKKPLEEAYYRIRNIDYDGASETFDWVFVKRGNTEFKLVNLYPNPATNTAHIEIVNPIDHSTHIELRDMVGKVILSKDYDAKDGLQSIDMDLSNISAGTYNLSIDNSKDRIIKMLIIR